MLRGCTLVTALVLAVAVLWGAPVSAHPALEAQADLPVAIKSPALAWSSAPTPPALPWPVVLAVAVVSIAAWRRPRRALALAIVLILGLLAFENGVHGGRSFQRAGLVHADRWTINACPHRGGSIAMDDRGRLYAAWYTETADGQPRMLFAAGGDGGRFGPPVRLNTAAGYIPDQVRLASDPAGRVAIVREEATAVRRRVMLRYSIDGGRTLSAPQALSQALKAYAPDVAVGPSGEFVVAWHEEQFPALKTVTQAIKLPK